MVSLATWFRGLFGAKTETASIPLAPDAPMPTQGPRSFSEDNNDFALALYGRLQQQSGNLFLSPFSIRTVIGLTRAGARGETAAQISQTLLCSSSDTARLATVLKRLNTAGDGKYTFALANALWGQEGAPILPEFLDQIARQYDGVMHLVDFRTDAETARLVVNKWVETQTKERIGGLIPPDGVDADTRLVLVNAVYFKGKWVLPFSPEATRDKPFYLLKGGKVRVPMMYQHKSMRYMEAPGYQAVELIYHGENLSMLILLPERRNGLGKLEKVMSAQMLRDCFGQMARCDVKLYLPRFKCTWGPVDLKDVFISLGMTLPFDRFQADFSGINGCQPPDEDALHITSILHKAFVEVNEEGTEAVAATAVARGLMAASKRPPKPPPPRIFRADHPFLFAIRDRQSGVILFLGRMTNPTQES